MNHYLEINLNTKQREELVNVTSQLQQTLDASGVQTGILVAASLHTTAAMTVNENADPDVVTDLLKHLAKLVPHQGSYHHSEGNSDAHIKTSLTGLSVTIPIQAGRLVLGTWQAVYFCEFDGPRRRKFSVQIIS